MSGSDTSVPQLPPSLLDDIFAHAAAGYPREVCGLISGEPGKLEEVRRCDNRQDALHAEDPVTFPRDSRTAYNIGARDLLYLAKSLKSPKPVQVIYHSHVDVGAYFSSEDKAAATSEGELLYPVDYLVVDAGPSGVRGAKLFRFTGGDFVEVAAYSQRKDNG